MVLFWYLSHKLYSISISGRSLSECLFYSSGVPISAMPSHAYGMQCLALLLPFSSWHPLHVNHELICIIWTYGTSYVSMLRLEAGSPRRGRVRRIESLAKKGLVTLLRPYLLILRRRSLFYIGWTVEHQDGHFFFFCLPLTKVRSEIYNAVYFLNQFIVLPSDLP